MCVRAHWCAGIKWLYNAIMCMFWLFFLWCSWTFLCPLNTWGATCHHELKMNWSCCPFPLGIGSQSSTHRGKRRCAAAIRIEEGWRISRIFIWILCCEMPVTLRMRWSESPELVETGHIQPPFYGSTWQQHCDCWGSCRQFCCETFALQSTCLLQLGSRGHLTLWVLHSDRWYQVPAAGW